MNVNIGFTIFAICMVLFIFVMMRKNWSTIGRTHQALFVCAVAITLFGAYVHKGPLALPLFLIVGLIVAIMYFLKPKKS